MRRRRQSSTRRDPGATPAPDLVNRNFHTDAPDRLWVADLSRIPTGEGPLWLASVRDAFSRRIVGWKASDRADTQLVLGALEYGLWSRRVEREQLIFHSDHGALPSTPRFGSPSAWSTPAPGRPWAPSRLAGQRTGRELLLPPEGGTHLPDDLPHQRGG